MPAENDPAQPPPASRSMWLKPNTVSGTLIVATALCLICSLLVSATAVLLRPRIAANKQLKMQRNVLIAAGMFDPSQHTDQDIPRLMENVETVLINLPRRSTDGQRDAEEGDAGSINAEIAVDDYDARKAAKDPKLSVPIPAALDVAGIRRRERVAAAYVVMGSDGTVEQIVLPVYGKGLWSTLYGYLALKADARENMPVVGLTFYEHAETPGLGGEVDNPKWKAQWHGKELFAANGEPILDVTKPDQANAANEIDGITGATITCNGVENLVNYWLGDDAFGPFLERFRNGELTFTAESPRRGDAAEQTKKG